MNTNELLTRLLIGALMGGLIGAERQAHGRPAGFRTHMLVCVSSVLIMLISEFVSTTGQGTINVDPARIAAGGLTGIGFLGAGVIVRSGATVSGLTTAACIWMVAAIGMAIGAGMYTAASVAFIITLAVLILLRMVEAHMPRNQYRQVEVTGRTGLSDEALRAVIAANCSKVYAIDYMRDLTTGLSGCHSTVLMKRGITAQHLLDAITSVEGVTRASIKES